MRLVVETQIVLRLFEDVLPVLNVSGGKVQASQAGKFITAAFAHGIFIALVIGLGVCVFQSVVIQ